MKLLTFIAGVVTGVAVTLWWGGRQESDNETWKRHIGRAVADLNKDMCKVIRRVEELQAADADLPKYYFGNNIELIDCGDTLADPLADTQEIKVRE